MNKKPVFLYFIAIVLTLISIFKTLFGLSAPSPSPSPHAKEQKQLSISGYRVVSVATGPGRSGRDFSHGPIRRIQLHAKEAEHTLRLTIMPIRSRNEQALQMARMAAFEPQFYLRQRHLLLLGSTTSQGSTLDQQQEVAIGRGPKTNHPPVARLQSCLTPDGRAAVTVASIHKILYNHRAAEIARDPVQARLSRFLGLIPNTHWECLAIQLETPDAPGAETSLRKAWTELVGGKYFNKYRS